MKYLMISTKILTKSKRKVKWWRMNIFLLARAQGLRKRRTPLLEEWWWIWEDSTEVHSLRKCFQGFRRSQVLESLNKKSLRVLITQKNLNHCKMKRKMTKATFRTQTKSRRSPQIFNFWTITKIKRDLLLHYKFDVQTLQLMNEEICLILKWIMKKIQSKCIRKSL